MISPELWTIGDIDTRRVTESQVIFHLSDIRTEELTLFEYMMNVEEQSYSPVSLTSIAHFLAEWMKSSRWDYTSYQKKISWARKQHDIELAKTYQRIEEQATSS